MNNSKALGLLAVLFTLYSGIALAQVTTGTISGIVRDNSGATVAGAKVVVRNENTGISRTLDSDAEGRYSAESLNLGSYQVTCSREGFQTEVRSGIVLTVGRVAIVDFSLTVGAVTQSVVVKGEAPLVESTTASLGSLVDDQTIRALPLNGRSWDQLALVQPGVILTSPGTTSGTSYVYGTGKRFSVGGQRPESNSFLLDGTDINDQANGTPGGAAGTNLGVDTILEFKIFTNSFEAEYGHSAGSVVSSITRSGTNIIHGTAFEYIRNSVLDTRNYFDAESSVPPFKRNQFGGVLGGPIRKDKTFFFGGYEGLRQGQGTTQIATVPTLLARMGVVPTTAGATTTVTVPVNPAIVPFLNLYPVPNGRDFGDGTAQYLYAPNIITNEDNAMVRIDDQLNAKTNIFGRYTFDQDSVNAPQTLPDQVQVSGSRRQYTTLQADSILGVNFLNAFRFAFNRTHSAYDQITTPNPGAELSIIPGQPLGTLQIGASTGGGSRALTPLGPTSGQGPYTWGYNILEWGDDLSYIKGKHSFKVGADLQRLRDNTQNSSSLRGSYTFTSLIPFLAGTPSNLQASSPLGVIPTWGLIQYLPAIYGQDNYSISSRLHLDVGLRWETGTDPSDANGQMAVLPSPSATSTVLSDRFFSVGKKNFEPRVGLAWQLDSNGKTVLRIGAGIYHDQILPWLYALELKLPPFYGIYSITNPHFPNGYQQVTGTPSQIGTGTLNLLIAAPVQKTPVTDEYNLSIQHEIFGNTVIQVSYAGNNSAHLPLLTSADTATPINCNASPASCPTLLPGQPALYYPSGDTRRNPAWAGISLLEDAATSSYNSATVTLRRQSSSGFQGEIFYTFSRALDDASNVSGGESIRSPGALLVPGDRQRDWGLSEFNSTNDLVANFTYPLPFQAGWRPLGAAVNGWTLDGIATFTSGQPFTARLAAAVSRDLSPNLTERPNLKPGFSDSPNHGVSAGCAGFAAGTPVGNAKNWYDPCAFSLPAAGTYGNVGRNTIVGPGVADMDLALEKIFKPSESVQVKFRAECFNIANHANFGLPNTSPLAASGAASPSAGVITYTTTSSRQMQFALRVSF